MTLAQVMSAHGKALGPLGVAVYAWIEANPGATFKEVADGMDMGESTVKRCVRQFEELGIASRLIETTPKGLALPTRIYPGTIERGTSDNPLRPVTPSPQNPVTIEPAEIIEPDLSDPGTIERGASGTKVAPSKAETTNKKIPQPSVEARRKRQRPRKEGAKPFDPRIKHPAIEAVRGFIHCLPDEQNRDDVIQALGEAPDMHKLSECYRIWKKQGFSKVAVAPATDWYVNGIPEKYLGGNGRKHEQQRNGKPTREETYYSYDYSGIGEGEGAGGLDSEVPADEWVELTPAGRSTGDDRRVARSPRH